MELLCCTPETNTIINRYYKRSYKATILQKKNRSNHNISVCAYVCVCVCWAWEDENLKHYLRSYLFEMSLIFG